MPRRSRQKSGTGIYHVMLRGINKQDIFDDDEDYIRFQRILQMLTECYDEIGNPLPPRCSIYAYCLMSNHVHLLLRERTEEIGESIKRIGVAYARYYNWKYKRNGYLFQDRFRSEAVETIEYFMTLVRYIHQNPVKAGIVKDVSDYAWSSWHEYEGGALPFHICETTSVIKRLGNQDLHEFVSMPVDGRDILDIDSVNGDRITDDEIKAKLIEIAGIVSPQEIQKLNKQERNIILKQLSEYGANIRQISRITGVSYGIIYRAKTDH